MLVRGIRHVRSSAIRAARPRRKWPQGALARGKQPVANVADQFRGIINELYLTDLKKKTHRGQMGQVLRGFSVGSRGYGTPACRMTNVHVPEELCVFRAIVIADFAAS